MIINPDKINELLNDYQPTQITSDDVLNTNKKIRAALGELNSIFIPIFSELLIKYTKNNIYKNIITARKNSLYKFSSPKKLTLSSALTLILMSNYNIFEHEESKTHAEIDKFLKEYFIDNGLIYYAGMSNLSTTDEKYYAYRYATLTGPLYFDKYVRVPYETFDKYHMVPKSISYEYCVGMMNGIMIQPYGYSYTANYTSLHGDVNRLLSLLNFDCKEYYKLISVISRNWCEKSDQLVETIKKATDKLLSRYGQHVMFSSL